MIVGGSGGREMEKILNITSECVPFIKTGGLADVVGTLPNYCDHNRYDIRVVLPFYSCIGNEYKEKVTDVCSFYIEFAGRTQYVGIKTLIYNEIQYYFIDNENYFNVAKPYSQMSADLEKFCFFSKAALLFLEKIEFKPSIIQCHDWESSVVPVYLNQLKATQPFYKDMKTIMTIHNLCYQGTGQFDWVRGAVGLSREQLPDEHLASRGGGSILKAGIIYADYITTVSQAYAREIQTPEYGEGLDGIIEGKKDRLFGILNGIDYQEYNPATDMNIYKNFDVNSVRELKRENKFCLQSELHMPVGDDYFMIGVISRLTEQKGLDLINSVLEDLCHEKIQLVVLGTGDYEYERLLEDYERRYHDNVSASLFYSDERAHKIYASCDALLMPSRFEPCGLCQLMALRYGTVPIVRETGGLKETVVPYDNIAQTGNGFSFTNFNAYDMLNVIRYAKHVFQYEKDHWYQIIQRGMNQDFSWNESARKYQNLYDTILQYK